MKTTAMMFCKHGLPTCGTPCRFCADGSVPAGAPRLTQEERAARVAAIEAERAATWTMGATVSTKGKRGRK